MIDGAPEACLRLMIRSTLPLALTLWGVGYFGGSIRHCSISNVERFRSSPTVCDASRLLPGIRRPDPAVLDGANYVLGCWIHVTRPRRIQK